MLRPLLLPTFVLLTAAACKTTPQASPDAAPAPAASEAGALAEVEGDGGALEPVRPVYPAVVKPEPIAVKLCEALHALPEKTRATCCTEPLGFTLTSECTRVVSAALQFKSVTLDPADVDRCAADMEKLHTGCDWVGSHKLVPPASCEGILKGTVKTGAKCRSSLECGEGVRCSGVGPTTAGRCTPAGDDGMPCGISVDVLERYTRQQTTEQRHPACKGICDHHVCLAVPAVGAACKALVSCAPGQICANEKCAPARERKAGETCFDGECATGSYCVKGKCVTPQPAGAACTTEFECVGNCLLADGGTKGVCGKQCAIR